LGLVYKLVPGTITDCNQNGIHDACDIAAGTSHDWNGNGVPDECEPTGVAGCFGDGSVPTACPCGNTGALGHGCENSAGTGGAKMEGIGDPGNDDVVLVSSGELPTVLTIFLQGDLSNPNGVVFGDGLRCVAGALKRMYAKVASGGVAMAPGAGELSITVRSSLLGDPIVPLSGQVRYYQARYRETDALRFQALESLCAIPEVELFDSCANFYLLKTGGISAAWLEQEAERQGVFIRHCDSMSAQFHDNFVRMAVKRKDQNARIVATLKSALMRARVGVA